MEDTNLMSYLEENPRMIGVLFAMMLAVSQAGNASAGVVCTTGGP